MLYDIIMGVLASAAAAGAIWSSVRIEQARRRGEIRYIGKVRLPESENAFIRRTMVWAAAAALALALVIGTMALVNWLVRAIYSSQPDRGDVIWLVEPRK